MKWLLNRLAKTKQVSNSCTKFTITVTMKNRWIPPFLAMLKHMQLLGEIGSSRLISFYSDGDGDFRPKFEWSDKLLSNAKPVKDSNGNRTYDAG